MISTTVFDRHIISVCLIAILFLLFDTSIAVAQTATEGERIARLEGAYDHLATKEGIARLETQVLTMRAELDSAKWFVIISISIAALLLQVVGITLTYWIARRQRPDPNPSP